MSNISVSINEDLQKRIAKIAKKSGRSVEECVAVALSEYIDNYEGFYKTDICAMDNLERSFFLSIAE